MKLAVAYENGMVFQHFGRSQQFLTLEIEQDKIINKSILHSNGQGHGALVTLLINAGINTLICGGLGQGARNALMQAGITVIRGASGNVDIAVDEFLHGRLQDNPLGQCNHHSKDHECSHHSCS